MFKNLGCLFQNFSIVTITILTFTLNSDITKAEEILIPEVSSDTSYVLLTGSKDNEGLKDYILQGEAKLYTSNDYTIEAIPAYNNDPSSGIRVRIIGRNNSIDYPNIEFDAKHDENKKPVLLRTGIYTEATRFPFNKPLPQSTEKGTTGFSFSGFNRGCNELNAEFNITTIEFNPDNRKIKNLEASFKQFCDGNPLPTRGIIKIISPSSLFNTSRNMPTRGVTTKKQKLTKKSKLRRR